MNLVGLLFAIYSFFKVTQAAFPAIGYAKEPECLQRPLIENAIALESEINEARYVCLPGYVMVSPDSNALSAGVMRCVSNNTWNPSILPVCKCIASFDRLNIIDEVAKNITSSCLLGNQDQRNLTLGCQRYQDNYILLAQVITGLSVIISILLCTIAVITFKHSSSKKDEQKEHMGVSYTRDWLRSPAVY